MSQSTGPAIGIIGAGAGGLSLARILTERGFANVTVLERSDRIGGKSLTYRHEGVPHEMGTCYTTYGYTYVSQWMAEYGIDAQRLPKHRILLEDGSSEDFKDYVLGPSKVKAYLEILRYMRQWLKFFLDQQLERNPARFNEDMALSFGAWLDKYDYKVVKRFAWRTITAMGYGHLYEVPALNGLRWNVPSLLLSAAAIRVDEPIPGYQVLWENMAWELDVRLEHEITAIRRQADDIEVDTNHGTLHFDHLVLTTAPDELHRFMDVRPDEAELFAHFGYEQYVTTLVEATGWFQDENTWSFAENLFGSAGERRGRLLVARRTGDKTPAAVARTKTRKDIYVCYQYGGDGVTDEELDAGLRADIEERGGTVVSTITRSRWKYMPRLSKQAINAGAVWKLRDLQGKANTWYSGGAFSHEAVDNIVDFNMQLADRMEFVLNGYANKPLGNWRFLTRKKWEHVFTVNNK